MNVRWIQWSELLEQAGYLLNLDEDLGQILGPQARRLSQAVNVATDFAWKFHPWSPACWVMRLLHDGAGVPTLEPGYSVLGAYSENPLSEWDSGLDTKALPFRETQGAVRLDTAGRELEQSYAAYYMVRMTGPRFGGEARNTATTYVPGNLVYDAASGECWRCVREHTNQSLPPMAGYWTQGTSYTAGFYWRNGVLFGVAAPHTASDVNEPALGVEGADYWILTPKYWTPMRLPEFLLTAVLSGARSWLESASTEAMQTAMLAALEQEVSDYTITRGQRFAPGRSSSIL